MISSKFVLRKHVESEDELCESMSLEPWCLSYTLVGQGWMDGWMMTMRSMHLVFFCTDDVIGMRRRVCMRFLKCIYIVESSTG